MESGERSGSEPKARPGPPIVVYEEVPLEEMEYEESEGAFYFSCPCGDLFEISLTDMVNKGETIARCPSCSLLVRVLYQRSELRSLCDAKGLAFVD
uniref:Diphthamide biosynthesis protein 3 n=1 Tax=Chromera velia CCMP2878 TaxID=1169474 RepID=A0A0G4HR33_9ALVE|mmetsp:Transcript_44214/g.87214  ORF Transcript_44214/g.87214 Transcript_44214/m.87214 type:complete len:96 (+) Transcript_44214:174-461(+)|eukprot:Cvel_8005.t1-p1 / transcript=Cvel_8005.t1 / gene=Cvel_8005 / organism=Chromera_velia_CCMP2878 / gene_product=Diphthamide biosynthesis protein 3, putative / transcript_product=Diphthamide biosynthesis protein 3, putative / location=Cvel_scaffold431:61641-61925(+) / protein_length=95 / sequence_SO=supercontig / SO=protein_coding / is_pseudo=false